MNIRKRVLLTVSLLIAIIVSILTNIGYSIAKENIEKYVNLQLSKVIEIETIKFDSWILEKKLLLKNLVKVLETLPYDEKLYELYMHQTKNIMNIYGVFAGFSNGDYFDTADWIEPEGWHPTLRPWFKNTINFPDKIIVQGPVKYTITDETYFYISHALIEKNKPSGVIVSEVRTDEISEILQKIRIFNTGFVVMIHKKDGKILMHPNNSFVGITLNTLGLKDLSKQVLSKQSGTVSFSFENEEKIAFFKHVKQGPWILIAMVDKEEMHLPLKKLLKKFSILGVVFIFLTLMIIYVVNINRRVY